MIVQRRTNCATYTNSFSINCIPAQDCMTRDPFIDMANGHFEEMTSFCRLCNWNCDSNATDLSHTLKNILRTRVWPRWWFSSMLNWILSSSTAAAARLSIRADVALWWATCPPCVNFLLVILFRQIISGSTGQIFTKFSPCARNLAVNYWSLPSFSVL